MKNSKILEYFQGSHITLLMRQKEHEHDEKEETMTESSMLASGFLVEADDEYLYLTPNLQMGITEAIKKSEVIRVILSDVIEDSVEEEKTPSPSEMN